MHRSPRSRFAAASVAVVATLALAACGDDDDDAGSDTVATVDTVITADTTDETTADTDTTDMTEATDETAATDDTTSGSGAGGEVGERQDYVDAAEGQIPAEDEEFGACIADAMVTDDVYAAIEEQGVTVDEFAADGPAQLELDEDAVGPAASALADCGDLIDLIPGVDAAQRSCVEDNLSNEQIAELFASSLFEVEPTGELTEATEAVDACVEEQATTTT